MSTYEYAKHGTFTSRSIVISSQLACCAAEHLHETCNNPKLSFVMILTFRFPDVPTTNKRSHSALSRARLYALANENRRENQLILRTQNAIENL